MTPRWHSWMTSAVAGVVGLLRAKGIFGEAA